MGHVSFCDAATPSGSADTNLILCANDLTKADWVKITMTVTPGITDPFGGAKAFTLTATGATSDIRQTLAAGSSKQRINDAWVRRRTGVGIVNIIDPDAAGTLAIHGSLTSQWQRFAGNPKTSATRCCGFQIVTSGDAIDIYCPQLQNGATPSTLDILTFDTPMTGLANWKPRPGDRLFNWNPDASIFGEEEEALGTGQLYTFSFRSEYLVDFDMKGIPQSSLPDMLRLSRHLRSGGTVCVTTGDTANRVYSTCTLRKGGNPSPKLTDPKLLEYTMSFSLRNVAGPVDVTDMVCTY